MNDNLPRKTEPSHNASRPKACGAVIVTRVSTGEQAEHGTSLASQLDSCRAKAATLGIPIVAEYEDAGVSGALFHTRQGIQAGLGHLRAGSADTLIVANISRLSRDIAHQQEIRRQVESVGGRVVFCDLNIDLSTPEGDLSFGIFGSFAQYERKLIRDRTIKGRHRRIAEGIQTQRSAPPYGYYIVTRDHVIRGDNSSGEIGHYVIIEAQAAVVRRIYALYNEGRYGTPRIASLLNRDGVPTPRGGCRWQASTIRSMLLNPAYKGMPAFGRTQSFTNEDRLKEVHPFTGRPLRSARYGRPVAEDKWVYLSAPAIVDEASWQAVHDRFANNQRLCGGNPRRARMLSGRVRCAYCGAPMVTTGPSRSIGYYTCSVNRVVLDGGAAKGCTGDLYNIAATEHAVVTCIEDMLRHPDAVEAARQAYKEPEQPAKADDIRSRIAEINNELAQLRNREAYVVKAQIEGVSAGADTSAYLSILADIAVRRKDAADEIGVLNRALVPIKMPITARNSEGIDSAHLISDLHKVLASENITGAEKRDFLGQVVERVVPQKGGADVHFVPGLFSMETCQSV